MKYDKKKNIMQWMKKIKTYFGKSLKRINQDNIKKSIYCFYHLTRNACQLLAYYNIPVQTKWCDVIVDICV